MPSLGPELPPHLQKRKRSIDDSELPNSPPRKLQAAAPPRVLGPSLPPTINPDEVNIENSDDDDYGPSIRPSNSKRPESPPRKVIGPSAPPKSTSPSVIGPSPPSKNPDELEIESSDDDDSYGPSSIKNQSMAVPPPKRVLGPALPPASLAERPSYPPNSDSDSDSDYGPSLPPAAGSTAAIALENQRAQEAQAAAAKSNEPSKPQRPDWMLAPPTSSDWTSKIDPTKLKARKFAGGKGAKAPGEKTGVSAIWTETPEEKRQRLEDAVLGRQDSDTSSARTRVETKVDEETDKTVREYNAKNRGKSLYEAHADGSVVAGKGKKEEEDDPSQRGFDREKDMALGGRLGHAKKKELLNRAADFGSRFQKGSYL
ncbi:7639e526-d7aa-4d30-8a47-7c1795a3d209 [Sclerotinia trifoliorum]|uniref:7639e526-d7aa-4d30-8a47-7c1795a3d209 n=1 Tax=Sclerotinia trifoliorum TaxID=28548 RepID=A0A8H2ZPD0_9HELO|nr:7639e526-d7aa-4d30-8a47-7c1795a3d209 [Sclerotinia trifoliorum]